MARIKKTSMQDIADYMGVSKNCISIALNNKKGVSEALRSRIIQAARELNYAGFGKNEEHREHNAIVVITPEHVEADRNFYPEFIWDIEREARIRSLNVIMTVVTAEMEQGGRLPGVLYALEHCGVIVLGVMDKRYVQKLMETRWPIILVDTYHHDLPCHAVITENMQGAYAVTRHLIEHGHTNIGFIGPVRRTSSMLERWLGFTKAMEDFGLTVHRPFCLLDAADHCCSEEEIACFTNTLEGLPTAWFCANDVMAISLIHVLNAMGLCVPEEQSVAGFDDVTAASLIIPRLTTFRVMRDSISRQAVETLISLMDHEQPPVKICVYGELVVRDSVRQTETTLTIPPVGAHER